MIRMLQGDCRDVLRELDADSISACFTDPPYGLEFMGKQWDSFGRTRDYKARAEGHSNTGILPHYGRGGTSEQRAQFHTKANLAFHAFNVEWAHELYRVLKPGAYLMACGGTRTYHRLACAIEDAGFEIRDACAWLYGSGFPKSRDASKAIDQELGAEREVVGSAKGKASENLNQLSRPSGADADEARSLGAYGQGAKQITVDIPVTAPATPQAAQWQGFGTALKPAQELIVLARKPMTGNLAQNLMRHGTGAINVDACRVEGGERPARSNEASRSGLTGTGGASTYGSFAVRGSIATGTTDTGRWPANVQHDGSEEVLQFFPASDGQQGAVTGDEPSSKTNLIYGEFNGRPATTPRADAGSAARFFFSPKADAEARIYECTICQRKINAGDRARHKHGQKNNAHIKSHPTVKPIDLIRHYLRLIVPPGGTVLDPFAGTGTTGEAAMLEGFDCLMIERDEGTVADIQHRIGRWSGQDAPLFAEAAE